MSKQQSLPISVQPVISYPREAQVGKIYLITVDLRLMEGTLWPFGEEEYPIYCLVDSEPLFSCEPVGEPAIVLHRFGGTYGAAKFTATASSVEAQGSIQVKLVNGWGVPIKVLTLDNIKTVRQVAGSSNSKVITIKGASALEETAKLRRSIRASPEEIEKANLALAQYSLSQNALAQDLGLSRQTINNFFKGKPINRENFVLICDRLGLDLENMVALSSAALDARELSDRSNLDALVQAVRQKVYTSIKRRCGTMRVLDMERPISLDSIYTKVNILEKVNRNQRRTLAELLEGYDEVDFDRFTLGRVSQKRIPGVEAVQRHDKLLILGKPGAGKTTFLKWLAIKCNEGQLHANRIPIFITLKDFAEQPGQPSLQAFIRSHFEAYGIADEAKITEMLLQEGRLLVLLDGLDEVRDVEHDRVLQEICDTSAQFHTSQFVITCRIAAREYTFQQFIEVEVADFDNQQITEFSHKWFGQKDLVKAEQFSKELKTHQPLKELATNPLLLTLLCLVFEERAGFPANRAELYKEGLDVLLKKWDVKRNIQWDEVYKGLSLKRKEDVLSQIAFATFERSEYFFKQKVVEQQIEQYIRNLPNATTDPEALQTESTVILKSIEAQHGLLVERARGIYSFSHLTFHEYFTARWIEKREELHPFLISHLAEKRWREVVLLTVGMLEQADSLLLLMKLQIDEILAIDKKGQQFLDWVHQKTCSVNAPHKPTAIRAFYFHHALARDLAIDHDLTRALDHNLTRALDYARDHALAIDHALGRALDHALDHALAIDHALGLALDHALAIEPPLKQSLEELKNQLPNSNKDWKLFQKWWGSDGLAWIAKLRSVLINHRNIRHDWQFSDHQRKQLQQYYDANKLLVECLNSDCYVSREVREEIEVSLLLPIEEIKHRFPNQLNNFSTS